ncbi:hypothetical protein vseg_012384 [Gypsophila vaccaria]
MNESSNFADEWFNYIFGDLSWCGPSVGSILDSSMSANLNRQFDEGFRPRNNHEFFTNPSMSTNLNRSFDEEFLRRSHNVMSTHSRLLDPSSESLDEDMLDAYFNSVVGHGIHPSENVAVSTPVRRPNVPRPTVKWSKRVGVVAGEEKQTHCSICQDKFKKRVRVTPLDCGHVFHPNCIEAWLEHKNTCPLCRSRVNN